MHASVDIPTRERAPRSSRHDADTWNAEDLAAIWESQHEVVDDRLATIEQAIHALERDRLDADLTDRAARAAHMLAGSLGMFGFGDASKRASDLELALSRLAPDDVAELSAALASIRREIA